MDNVNHPSHYNQNGIETIDIIQAYLDDDKFEGFLLGNIIKYLDRFKFKNGEEDLKKAQWYLKKYIAVSGKNIEEATQLCKKIYNGDFDTINELWTTERQFAESTITARRKEATESESIG